MDINSTQSSVNNLIKQLQEKSQKKSHLTDKVNIDIGDKFISAQNIESKEDYTFKKPFLLAFKKEINNNEVEERLSTGKKVFVEETLTVSGEIGGKEQIIDNNKAFTRLTSVEDLASFTRVETSGEPKNEQERVAMLLEKLELKNTSPDKNQFFKIYGENTMCIGYGRPVPNFKELSSSEAANKLLEGKPVFISENKIDACNSLKGKTVGAKDVQEDLEMDFVSSVEDLEKYLEKH